MKGADGVRDRLAELLRYEVTRKAPLLREVWSLGQDRIPDVEQFVSGETENDALTSDGNTWVVVINPRLQKMTRVDIDNAGRAVYMSRYSCRIGVYAKGDTWKESIAARDHVALMCRLSLLEYPNLSATVRGDTGDRVHENTYTEEFGEPRRVRNSGGRAWAGALLSVDVDCEETLADGSTRPPIGEVDQAVTVDTEVVGTLDPLPESS